ncbi:hypothetical protein [Nibribacter koreensis]|uniref:Uncharacterized protein n=1 Tax=Nibribacter koreensis TaxID=1084519 RepID=A0ABP8FZG5_9BACT
MNGSFISSAKPGFLTHLFAGRPQHSLSLPGWKDFNEQIARFWVIFQKTGQKRKRSCLKEKQGIQSQMPPKRLTLYEIDKERKLIPYGKTDTVKYLLVGSSTSVPMRI